jgi:hypothetical protein
LLKEKCPWHLDGNHTTEQCYQLRRALKNTPEPPHPHDKKGKKKHDDGNADFQEPDKTVNVLFGGLPSRREQKATRREVMSIKPAVPTPSTAEESRPEPSATTGTEEPVAAQAEEEAPAEAGLIDIASILGALTVTVVWSSL